jgi:hypothetical protein
MCSSATLLSLDQMDTNYVVAMNNTQLGTDPSMYCGRELLSPSMDSSLTCSSSLETAASAVASALLSAIYGMQRVLRALISVTLS